MEVAASLKPARARGDARAPRQGPVRDPARAPGDAVPRGPVRASTDVELVLADEVAVVRRVLEARLGRDEARPRHAGRARGRRDRRRAVVELARGQRPTSSTTAWSSTSASRQARKACGRRRRRALLRPDLRQASPDRALVARELLGHEVGELMPAGGRGVHGVRPSSPRCSVSRSGCSATSTTSTASCTAARSRTTTRSSSTSSRSDSWARSSSGRTRRPRRG